MRDDWRPRFASVLGSESGDLLGGDAGHCNLAFKTIHLQSGSRIELERGGVTAIVGANNSGKSTLLYEVHSTLQSHPDAPLPAFLSVAAIELDRRGSAADLTAWIGERLPFVASPIHGVGFAVPDGSGFITPDAIRQAWASGEPGRASVGADLAGLLCFFGDASGRLALRGSSELRDSASEPPTHPVHRLQDERALLDELSYITENVFGRPLTLDTLGRTVRLRVGRLEMPAPPVDNIPREYVAEMAGLRPLDQQGDGMRSMLGQLLPILTGTHQVVLIDEPEAFLHPPQAYALGRQLGKLASERSTQVIVATHDRNFLSGLLASGASTSVVRLSRAGDGATFAHQLDANALRSLWADPVLKYTNMLDGLFHRLVVLAEAEGDCGYLAAALDCSTQVPLIPPNEVLFVPTGGKDGMTKVARALRAVDVPIVAAPDFDRIAEKRKLGDLVEALGSEWDAHMSGLWERATRPFREKREPALVRHVLSAVRSALEGHEGEPYTDELRTAVLANLRSSGSPWAAVKEHGIAAFRSDARVAMDELVDRLDAAGVVLVREGELEQLAPAVAARKGPGWLHAALAAGAQRNDATQAHLGRILAAALRSRPKPATVVVPSPASHDGQPVG